MKNNKPSAIEILLDYPREKGLPYETHESEQRFISAPGDPYLKSRYVFFKQEDLFFLAYDAYATKAYSSQTFSGLYKISNENIESEFTVYKKHLADILLRTNKKRADNSFLNTHLTFVSNRQQPFERWISEASAKRFLELNQIITPLKLIVKYDYLPLIPKFKEKTITGIETQQWLYKKEDIDHFFEMGTEILHAI